jgi:hypothetical protein
MSAAIHAERRLGCGRRTAPTDYVPAAELKPGDQIRDRGALRTIVKVEAAEYPHACVTVVMANGSELAITPNQRVYVWRH